MTDWLLLMQDWIVILARIVDYLTKLFTFGRITVSVSGFITAFATILITIFVARWSTVLIERRMSNRRYIDPGMRYTICRLVKYVIIVIGGVVALGAGVKLFL